MTEVYNVHGVGPVDSWIRVNSGSKLYKGRMSGGAKCPWQ